MPTRSCISLPLTAAVSALRCGVCHAVSLARCTRYSLWNVPSMRYVRYHGITIVPHHFILHYSYYTRERGEREKIKKNSKYYNIIALATKEAAYYYYYNHHPQSIPAWTVHANVLWSHQVCTLTCERFAPVQKRPKCTVGLNSR